MPTDLNYLIVHNHWVFLQSPEIRGRFWLRISPPPNKQPADGVLQNANKSQTKSYQQQHLSVSRHQSNYEPVLIAQWSPSRLFLRHSVKAHPRQIQSCSGGTVQSNFWQGQVTESSTLSRTRGQIHSRSRTPLCCAHRHHILVHRRAKVPLQHFQQIHTSWKILPQENYR